MLVVTAPLSDKTANAETASSEEWVTASYKLNSCKKGTSWQNVVSTHLHSSSPHGRGFSIIFLPLPVFIHTLGKYILTEGDASTL